MNNYRHSRQEIKPQTTNFATASVLSGLNGRLSAIHDYVAMLATDPEPDFIRSIIDMHVNSYTVLVTAVHVNGSAGSRLAEVLPTDYYQAVEATC